MPIEVSRDEAIATALIAKMIGRELGFVNSLSTQEHKLHQTNVDINKIISELNVIQPPKPDGPVIPGAAVNGEQHEVVLHPIDVPITQEPTVELHNPFSQSKPVTPTNPNNATSLNNGGISPMAQFLGKKQVNSELPIKQEEPIKQQAADDSLNNNLTVHAMIISLYEKVLKMEENIAKILKNTKKQKAKKNESKDSPQ